MTGTTGSRPTRVRSLVLAVMSVVRLRRPRRPVLEAAAPVAVAPPPPAAHAVAAHTQAVAPAEGAGAVDTGQPPDRMPGWVFPVALAWLLVTLAVFVVYETTPGFRGAFPARLGPYIPITVPWFGALGGCVVSLAGISDHNKDWNARYNYWHPVRPLVGAVTGAIGCLLLLVTTELATTGAIRTDPAFYDGVAFVFGYAESAFRGLIKSLTDVILKPGDSK